MEGHVQTLAILPTGASPTGARSNRRRSESRSSSDVQVPGTLTACGFLRSQTGLTANLQGFTIGALEGWPLLQCRLSLPVYGAELVRAAAGSHSELVRAVGLRGEGRRLIRSW